MNVRYIQQPGAAQPLGERLSYRQPSNNRKSLLQTLVEVAGRDSVQKMILKFGGARIWVPVRSTPQAKLTQTIGEGAAAALCTRFGGDYLQVPNTMADVDEIQLRIAELHRQGCKINDIALAVGRSRRTVFRLLRKKITDLRRPGRLACDPKSIR